MKSNGCGLVLSTSALTRGRGTGIPNSPPWLARRRKRYSKNTRQRNRDTDMSDRPIPMRLNCPACGELHIDEGEFATKIHHTHACQHCGMVWRPAKS